MRKYFRAVSLFVMFMLLASVRPVFASDTTSTLVNSVDAAANTAYKAVVRIKSYDLDSDFYVTHLASGSGVIISAGGLVLTNSHVVVFKNEFDNSPYDVGYVVCLPSSDTTEPDCSYTARLVSYDTLLDVAILQIQPIKGMSGLNTFPFLSLMSTDTAQTNDPVTVLGYPSIGGESISITKGVLSGKTEKNNQKWLKTDAVISYGSSGGAAINTDNVVVGIPTAGNADYLGSMGYLINMSSIYKWIEDNKSNGVQGDPLHDEVVRYVQIEKNINNADTFINTNPYYKITKPNDWQFKYFGSNKLMITDSNNYGGGYISVIVSTFPTAVDIGNVLPFVKLRYFFEDNLQSLSVQQNKNVILGGFPAKKIFVTSATGSRNMYVVPIGNRLITIYYNYGANDQDKAVVDSSIKTFASAIPAKPRALTSYNNNLPYFKFIADKNWALSENNQKNLPIFIYNKKNKDVLAWVLVTKLSDNDKSIDADGVIKNYKDYVARTNKLIESEDIKSEIVSAVARYSPSKKLGAGQLITSEIKTTDGKKLIAYKINYSKRLENDDYTADVVFISLSGNKKLHAQYQKDFKSLLQNMSL